MKRVPIEQIEQSAAFDWLRDMGISDANLRDLAPRLTAIREKWKRQRKDETIRERRKRLRKLASRLRRLGKDLDADTDAAHISLTELRDNTTGGADVVLTRSKFTNRPTIGAVLSLMADDLACSRPYLQQWDRLVSLQTYVIAGLLIELSETPGYGTGNARTGRPGRTPNKHIAELTSILCRRHVRVETVRKQIHRLCGGD